MDEVGLFKLQGIISWKGEFQQTEERNLLLFQMMVAFQLLEEDHSLYSP